MLWILAGGDELWLGPVLPKSVRLLYAMYENSSRGELVEQGGSV
jgi:hypothetical protein